MKRFLTVILLTACFMPAWSQITHTSNGAVDKNAETILKKATEKINSGAVSFTVTMINKNTDKKETARMKASVLYKKGLYHVSFDGNELYCDGTSTWHWNKETNEVVVNKMSESEDNLLNPGAILSNYKKSFKAKFIRQEQNGNAVIDMTPLKSKSYHKIRLIINSTSGILQRLEMHNYDSSSGEYIISNFKSNVKSADTDFTFPKAQHPNAEIIDMR